MVDEISDFLYGFKNKIIEADEIASKYALKIEEYAQNIVKNGFKNEFEENYYTILGYSYRLEDVKQRLFFTFQEAVYAIDLDKLMKNQDSLKLNSIVYILVLDFIIKEYNAKVIDEKEKQKALEVYKKIEDKKSAEDKKYHMYQY